MIAVSHFSSDTHIAEVDHSGVEPGMRVQAEADGVWYAAEVQHVSKTSDMHVPLEFHWLLIQVAHS